MRPCLTCGTAIFGRADRVYCSTRCRTAAHRRAHLPPPAQGDLRELVRALDPAKSEVALLAGVAVAARQDWRAAAWLLERRWPHRWALSGSRVAEGDVVAAIDL